MMLWENLDGSGLCTGIVIDPARGLEMQSFTDGAGQTQALCLARTAENGGIRWFVGFGWQGQGEITTAEKWTVYLKNFAAKFIKAPYAEPAFEVHVLEVPAAPTPAPEAIPPKAE